MKLGEMVDDGWTFDRLAAEGWVPAHGAYQDYVKAGFRLRSLSARVFVPAWIDAFDRAQWAERKAKGRREVLTRVADRVRPAQGGGHPVRRSKKYPRSTTAWMAELGYADMTGFPRYVREAVCAAGVPTRWRGRMFAPAWVRDWYNATAELLSPNPTAPIVSALGVFTSVLRVVLKGPQAHDPDVVVAAHRLGGWDVFFGVLGSAP